MEIQKLMDTFCKYRVKPVGVKAIDGNDTIHLFEEYAFKTNAHILCYREK